MLFSVTNMLNVARTGPYIVEQIVGQYDISRPFFPFCEIPPTGWTLVAHSLRE